MAVAVVAKGCRAHAVAQHTARLVFCALKLVAHYGHFAVKVSAGELGLRHHARQPSHHVVHALGGFVVIADEVGKIIGAVKVGGAVRAHTQASHVLHSIGHFATGLEQHML